MKKRPTDKRQSSAKRHRNFTGTDNPRHSRAKRLNVPCAKVPYLDRDGTQVLRGVYYLPIADRRKIACWLRNRAEGGVC